MGGEGRAGGGRGKDGETDSISCANEKETERQIDGKETAVDGLIASFRCG